eukprot:Gregarina_sp_Poly_1__7428@NODE_4121_length_724_cov_127_082192_g2701_i0_p1_GENE_NODE_4121_length_724_cov_127_082192_g2701_i0NODE_4121_length_724_cov_127_082192_g2701_i0_p1_ORF_typecomplete_len185_score24_69Ocnus/PF05005_15/1_9e18KxDL/PF10241_9/0_2DUF445/PF04286_12/0_16LzipperMIP1/PF14389_6/0_35SpoIIIAH/PF12685_7/0_5V_ATPase_I/PF01496_19/0_76Borrelia_REV/PF03978_13/1_2_NODE_4121_length_724_cov_127_082192_g2701_i0105659
MSATKRHKLLKEINKLNEELQNDTDLSETRRHEIQVKLKKLTEKYEAAKNIEPQINCHDAEKTAELLRNTPVAELDEGTHKFVLVQVEHEDNFYYFVRAKSYAKYHYMAADPLVEHLMEVVGVKYHAIEIPGGGRCQVIGKEKKVFVYGYSNQYGQAPMGRVVQTIASDPKYQGWNITYSLEGY